MWTALKALMLLEGKLFRIEGRLLLGMEKKQVLETEAVWFVWEEELLSEKEEKQMSQLERVLSLVSLLWYLLLSGIVNQPTQ